MKYASLAIFVSIMTAIMPRLIHAHGVQGIVENGGLVVTAQYDTGEAMSYARVNIAAPAAKLPFQSGRTDRNGRFCFYPDVIGEWKVVVDDEIGHRLEVMVPVNEAMELKTDKRHGGRAECSLSRREKALMGISIIFGIFGVFFWWKGKRIYSKVTSGQ